MSDLIEGLGSNTNFYEREDRLAALTEIQEERDKKIIKLAEATMDHYKAQRRGGKELEWSEDYLMRHGKRIGNYYQSETTLSSMEVHNCCKTITSRLRDVIFGEEEYFDLLAPDMLQPAADAYKEYMRVHLDNDGMYETAYALMDDLTTYGDCYAKVIWGINRKKHKRTVWVAKRKEKYPGVFSGITYKKKVIEIDDSLKDNIHVERVAPWNLYFDMEIPEMKNQNKVFEEIECSWRHIQKLSKQNMGEDGLYDIKPEYKGLTTSRMDKSDVEKKILEKSNITSESTNSGNKVSSRYRLWQMYFYYDINKDGMEELCMATLLVSGTKKVVIQRPIEFPYEYNDFPYVTSSFDEDANKAYGEGIPTLCKENHIVLSDNYSRLHDNATYRTNNMWLMDKMAGIAPTYLVFEPNKVIPTNKFPGIQAIQPDDMTQSHLVIEKLAVEKTRAASGALGTLQGLPTRYGTTAKESSQILTQANILVVDVVKRVEREFVNNLLERCASLIMQFVDAKQIAQYVGEEGLKIVEFKPWQVRGKCIFRAVGSAHIQNKMLLAQQLINLLNTAKGLPEGTLKVSSILKKWMEVSGIRNAERYINSMDDKDLLKPTDENILMNQGQRVTIHPKEDSIAHYAVHMAGIQLCPVESVELYKEHLKETQQKIMMEQQQAMLSQEMGAMGSGMKSPQQLPQTEKGQNMQAERQGGSRLGRQIPLEQE